MSDDDDDAHDDGAATAGTAALEIPGKPEESAANASISAKAITVLAGSVATVIVVRISDAYCDSHTKQCTVAIPSLYYYGQFLCCALFFIATGLIGVIASIFSEAQYGDASFVERLAIVGQQTMGARFYVLFVAVSLQFADYAYLVHRTGGAEGSPFRDFYLSMILLSPVVMKKGRSLWAMAVIGLSIFSWIAGAESFDGDHISFPKPMAIAITWYVVVSSLAAAAVLVDRRAQVASLQRRVMRWGRRSRSGGGDPNSEPP